MTCPGLLCPRGIASGAVVVASGIAHGARSSRQRLSSLLRTAVRGDGTTAQFSRFVFVGGVSSSAYAVLFVALAGLGGQLANLLGATTSTLLANELHRRTTFHAGGRVSWVTAQLEGGGLAVVGLVATSLSLAAFQQLVGSDDALVQLALIGGVTGAIGLVRFVALRAWVFGPARTPAVEVPGPDAAGLPPVRQPA